MPRPSDWSALGLGGDPTPGDADRIDEVISSQENLVSLADTIDDGLTSVLNTTDGIFVGETADALRKKIDGDLRKYVSSFRQAHKDVQGALRTYVDVMRTQQKRADDALTAAAALDEDDDAGREEQKGIAEDAKSQLETAASTASDTITDAAYSIASPIDECEEFWKALGWLALILIIPAMIVGGPLALFAIGLNVALLIKTAIDFSQGKASITDLVLSIIGVIAPTTKGIRLGDLWKGLKGLGAGAFKGAGNLFSGANSLGSLTRLALGFDDVFAASGNWLRGLKGLNGLKISGAGLHFMPGAKGFTMGINGIRDIKLVPAVSGLTVINLAGAKTFFAMKTVIGGLNGIRALGTTLVNTTVNGLRGANSLRLLLPVAADELGHGVLFALKIGVIDRGVFGLYRYGAFAGGQFIGAASKISGGVAHGLQLAPPTGGFGSFAHVNLSGFTPTPPTGIGGGFTSVHGLTGASAIGGINTSAFHGLGSTINSSVPALGAKVVDVPTISTLSGVNAVHIPTLGPMNAVSAPGIGATHIPGGVTDVGQVAAHGVDVPHLGAGVGRVDTPALGGLGQVHTPQLGSVAVPAPTQGHIAAPGQINAPAVHQINVPSLGSVSQGSVVGKLDAPPVGARVSDLPSVNVGVTHVNLPTTGHVSVPALGNGSEVSLPSVGRVDIAAVGRGTEISAPTVSRVDVPSAGASAPVTAPPVGHVDIPAVGATSAAAPPVAHVDAPAVRTGDTTVPPAAQVHSPTVHQPGQTQVQAPATAGHVTAVPGGGQVTVPPLSSGAGAGDGANGLGHLNGSVTGIDAKPTPMPATTGGLALPGSGSLIADLGKGGLVDLSALAQRTIRVNMVHTVQYDLQHTFRNMDELLPGVVVDVRPGTGATRADVTVTQTGGLSGVTAHHLQQGGRDILRIERTLGDGTVHRWNYYLDASTDYAPAGPMEIVPPGTRGSGDVELTSLPGGSHHPPTASTSAAVSVPAPAPLTRTLDVPGLNGVQLHMTPDGTGGLGHAAVTVQPGGGAWTATVRAGHTPGTPGIVHMEQRVSAVEVRHMDVAPQDGGGLRVLSDERFVTLSGGQFHGAVVALDSLVPNTVRHVPSPGAAAPGGVPGMVGHEIRMPSGSGFQLYDPATGLPTRSGLRLGDGAGGEIHVLPSRNGQQLGLTGPDGAPAPAPQAQVTAQAGGGFRVQYGESHVVVDATGARTHTVVPLGGTNDFVLTPAGGGGHTLVDAAGAAHARPVTAHGTDFHVPDGTNPRLTHVYDAHGAPTHDLLSLQHPGFAGRDVHLPTDGTPPTLHGATVTPQTGGGFRIDDPANGHHIVVGPQGAHTHNAIPLGTTGDLALRPTGPGPVTRVDLNGGARGPITLHGTDFHVPAAAPGRHHVYNATGTHTHDTLTLNHPAFNGRDLHLPTNGTPPTLHGATVTPQTGGGFRVDDPTGGHHVVFGPQGAHTHNAIPLGATGELALRPTGPGAVTRVDLNGGARGTVTVHGTNFHVPDGTNPHLAHVYDGAGTHTHDLLSVQHPAFNGRDLHLPADGTPPTLHGATVTPQTGGGFRIDDPAGHHIVVGPQGAHTHNAVPLGATGDLALRPTGPGPVTRVDLNGGARGPVTVHGTNFHVPDGTNPHLTHVYDGAGTHTHDLLALHGHPHLNGPLRTDPAGGNPTLGAGDTVVRQGDGSFRVEAGGNHAVFDGQGAHTHDVVRLGTGNEYAHMPVGGGAPRVVDAGGTPVPHATVVTRPDGHIVVTGTGGRVLYRPDGSVQAQVGHVLANGEGIRVHPGGHLALYSRDMNLVDDVTVTARPGGGHRITGADGQVRLFGPAGAHDYTIAPPGAGAHTFRVTDHAGGGHFDVVQLTDGVGTRFVRTDTHVLLDGDLAPVPAGTHTFAHQADGNYRLTFNGGGRANEYHLYNGNGQLFEQRINVFDKGTLKNDQFLKVTHPTDGVTKPSWERVRLDGTGQPVAAPAIKKWYDAGTVDTKGLGNGRVKLTTHSGVELMERRPLPNGHVLDGYHSAAGVGSFGRFNQRGVWTEFDGAGTVVGSGTRHWGESGRSWFDVTGHTGTRVRHYQELPDGGHVLADVGHRPFSQSFSGDTRWTRFDSEFKKVAEGDRTWGPGRGFTDHLPHPETGVRVVAQEKFGRFNWSVDDVRRLHQTEFGADGVPKKDYTSWSAHGKENGRGVTLKDGGFLDSTRFAEQRPPRVFRWMMSPEYRAANLDHVPWLAKDGRLQMHTWTETGAGGVTHGVRFVSNNGTITDISRAGDLVRETRKPLDGKAVTTGDVAMPDGVAKQNGYLPWKQGDDGLKGHRTYQATDFDTTNLPTGVNAGDIRWQERFTNDLGDGNWYTPNAGKQWHVARMGLADGSVVDFRPPPGAAGREGRMGAGSDWTRYDHHGLVISRQDTFPDPAGGANGIRITSQGMLDGTVRWSDGAGGGGIRRLNHHRGEVTPWGWDRESFQDFDAAGALVRDHRLLADGTVVDAWKNPAANTWHWNKIGADGEIKGFGNGVGDRVRQWFDRNGRRLPDFQPGAVFRDLDNNAGHIVQEIPVRPATTPHFQDSPYRVREYVQTPGGVHNPHVWKEYDNGIELGRKVELPDGSFLESEDWHKQWRRFGANGSSMIDERTIPGYVWHRDTFGRTTLTGRETNFTGILSEYRGFNRMWREPNRWEWGHTAGGVSTYTSFPYKAGQALAVDLIQEWLLDFGMNLAVYGIVAAATGTPFGWNEVGKAAFGATVGAGVKGAFSLGHFATFRGGPWKTGLSQVDQGNPYARRPNDDSWTAEFAGNEKVTRWRSGTYDWGVGLMTGAVSGFVTAAASSAIFGIKDANGNTVHLHGSDALLAGAVGMAGGVAGAVSLGVARTAMIQNFGGRFYHRGGVFDTFAVAGLGKLVDKTFANLYLSSTLQKQVFPGHDFYTGEQQNEQNGEPK
ncbi:hypothetical protein ACFY1V_04915 [Streptomyces sp. NPDC001255]|uniref:hypothetical protein n=1 Tax=Streptomyces sp. NPDC001255 TaxID=3364550 RepID=UPI00368B9E55